MVARKESDLVKVTELQHAVIPSLEEDTETWDKEESVLGYWLVTVVITCLLRW